MKDETALMALKGRQNHGAAARGKQAALRFKENPDQTCTFPHVPQTPNVCLELQENQSQGSSGKAANIWVYIFPPWPGKIKEGFISSHGNQSHHLCLFAVIIIIIIITSGLSSLNTRPGTMWGEGRMGTVTGKVPSSLAE